MYATLATGVSSMPLRIIRIFNKIDVLCNFGLFQFIAIIDFHIRFYCIYCVCFHLSSVSISFFFCWGLFRIYRVCVWVCLRDCRTIYPDRRTECLCRLITRGGPQVFGLCRWVADFRFSFTSLFARQVGIEICVGDGTRRADLRCWVSVCVCCFYSYFFISLFGVRHFSMLILCSVLAPSGLWIFFYEESHISNWERFSDVRPAAGHHIIFTPHAHKYTQTHPLFTVHVSVPFCRPRSGGSTTSVRERESNNR